jgi:hypothetical protein
MRLPIHADDIVQQNTGDTDNEADVSNTEVVETATITKTSRQRELEDMMYNFKKPKKLDCTMPLRYIARGAGAIMC